MMAMVTRVNPVGLIVSTFVPRDDATTFGFLVPSNFLPSFHFGRLSEIAEKVINDPVLASDSLTLAEEVDRL